MRAGFFEALLKKRDPDSVVGINRNSVSEFATC